MVGMRRTPPLPRLPVLFMFLKLPKLFNFHILRLAAVQQRENKEKAREGEEEEERGRGRKQVEALEVEKTGSPSAGPWPCCYLQPGPQQRLLSGSCSSSDGSSSCRPSGTTVQEGLLLLPPPGRLRNGGGRVLRGGLRESVIITHCNLQPRPLGANRSGIFVTAEGEFREKYTYNYLFARNT